ncbi:MAG: sensor histidine kinase, partial [Spirochaetota bacterium]
VDSTAREVLEDTNRKILTMALVHQQLYESHDLSRVELSDYLSKLGELLSQALSSESTSIEIEIDCCEYYLSVDVAIPLGQILNELISNSAKHAFTERSAGRISIAVREATSDELQLIYRDDGVGMPAGFDIHRDGNLGSEIIRRLAEDQLNGSLELLDQPGTTIRLVIPVTA